MTRFVCVLAAVAAASLSFSAIFTETEANDSIAAANVFNGVAAGDSIVGLSTGSSTTTAGNTSVDHFRLNMVTRPTGIYRNRAIVTTTGTAGHTLSLRGHTQSGSFPNGGTINTTVDTAILSSSATTTPSRFVQWYSFGLGEVVDMRVTGTSSTTANYNVGLEQQAVSVTNLGPIQQGAITFSTQTLTTLDSEIVLMDSSFNVIGSNDDSFIGGVVANGTTTQSYLTRNLTAGIYYVAVGSFNIAHNQPDPTDERTPTDNVLRTPGWLVGTSSASTSTPIGMSISGASGSLTWNTVRNESYQIQFARLEVVPEPATMLALAAGLAGLAARRRKKA